jgi:asparagine synthase (glutamine-hydrolysing)
MCGIAGIVCLSPSRPLADCIHQMTSCLRHRGGDDEGYALINRRSDRFLAAIGQDAPDALRARLPNILALQEGGFDVALGHVRFAIVDPSDAGHQPFVSADGSCCVAFNGEIYNHVEIRRELEACGVCFRTTCDTEVLVEAYVKWGVDCFQRFNGFWALAIYDRRSRQVLLSTDRVGKKQIYWSKVGDVVFFSSEIKALRAVEPIRSNSGVNERAALEWLALGRRDWSESTMFQEVNRLPAATWCIVDSRFPSNANRYWSLPNQRLSERQLAAGAAAEELRALLSDAVRIRMIADYPVGVELSGGLDSSVLAFEAAKHSSGNVSTYTVRVPEQRWDESGWAQSVARAIGSDHHVLERPEAAFWPRVADFVALHEEPVHSPNLFSNQALWTAMRSDGFRVSLNGAAGDELFAGYGEYFDAAQRTLFRQRNFAGLLSNALRRTERPLWLRPFAVLRLSQTWGQLLRTLRNSRSNSQATRLLTREFPGCIPSEELGQIGLSSMLYLDMTVRKMPYWLVSGDKNYMGLPIEVRAPFLDYRVVDFAFRLPESLLVRHGWHKWILRRAYAGLIPSSVIWRRRKMGFPIGLSSMLNQSSEAVRLICEAAENPFVDTSNPALIQEHWRVISFLLWFEYHIRGNRALFDRLAAVVPSSREPDYRPRYWSAASSS